jgi:hypothetical protein
VHLHPRGDLVGADRTDRVALDVTTGVVAEGDSVEEHPRPGAPAGWPQPGAHDGSRERVGALPHGDRRVLVYSEHPRHQGIGGVVAVSFDVRDLVAAAAREPDHAATVVLVDGHHERVSDRVSGQPPPEPSGMPP